MKKKTFHLVLVCCFFTACQSVDDAVSSAREILSLEAQIGNPSVASRYAISEGMVSSFVDGDQIGLYRDEEDVVGWTYNGTTWSSESIIYWESAETPHNFYAYYPFVSSERKARAAIVMPSLSKQSGKLSDISTCDFLVAQIPDRRFTSGSQISFTDDSSFEHVSSLVQFTFKAGGDLAGAQLKGIELSGQNLATSSTFSFDAEEGKRVTLLGEGGYSTITAAALSESMELDRTYYFVVNSYERADALVNLLITYEKGADEYSINVQLPEKSFVAGKLHPYAITIMNGVVQLVGADIRDWVIDGTTTDIVIDGSGKK